MNAADLEVVRATVQTVMEFERAEVRRTIWDALGVPDNPGDKYLLEAACRIRALRWKLEDAGNAGSLVRLQLEARDAADNNA
ncbi:MAG TPA: hypothetical protein VFQ88_14180 [Nevskiaceae bacterium]|nr:hypothetical protein [Nevskiaceae bacterium]